MGRAVVAGWARVSASLALAVAQMVSVAARGLTADVATTEMHYVTCPEGEMVLASGPAAQCMGWGRVAEDSAVVGQETGRNRSTAGSELRKAHSRGSPSA